MPVLDHLAHSNVLKNNGLLKVLPRSRSSRERYVYAFPLSGTHFHLIVLATLLEVLILNDFIYL